MNRFPKNGLPSEQITHSKEVLYAYLFITKGEAAANAFAQNGTWPADAPAIENQVKRIVARWPSAPPVDIALLLQGNCTDAQIDSFLQRVTDAQQKGHDAFGLTTDQLQAMLQLILVKLKSDDPAKQLEGREALLAIAGLTGIEISKSALGPSHGKISSKYDAVTAHAILQATIGSGQGKVDQLTRDMVTDAANYNPPKPIIFYDPTPLPKGMPEQTPKNMCNAAQQLNQRLGTHIEVYIITANGEWHLDASGNWQKVQAAGNSSSEAEKLFSQLLQDLGDTP